MTTQHGDEPFVAAGPGGADLIVSYPPVVVAPLRPGRRNTDNERVAQREAILQAALRSVERYGIVGLQPEKVAAVTNGSVTSQSIRRAFKPWLEKYDGAKSLRDVLEDALIESQLHAFQTWLQTMRTRTLDSEDAMVEGVKRIAAALLRDQAFTRLRTTDRARLEDFLTQDERAKPLAGALCDLATSCLEHCGYKASRTRVREFVTRNLRLLADDVALVRLESDAGATSFVAHLKRFAAKQKSVGEV